MEGDDSFTFQNRMAQPAEIPAAALLFLRKYYHSQLKEVKNRVQCVKGYIYIQRHNKVKLCFQMPRCEAKQHCKFVTRSPSSSLVQVNCACPQHQTCPSQTDRGVQVQTFGRGSLQSVFCRQGLKNRQINRPRGFIIIYKTEKLLRAAEQKSSVECVC